MAEVRVEACKVFTTVAKLPLSAVEVLSTAGIITVTGGATVTSSAGTRKRADPEPPPMPVQVHLDLSKALAQCASSDDTPPPRRRVARALHALLCALFGAGGAGQAELEADDVYERLREFVDARAARPSAPVPELPSLRPVLRGYQRDALGWMLAREGLTAAAVPPGSEVLWRCVHSDDGTPIYWNTSNGAMCLTPPPASPTVLPICLRGGILADEMGLGKSVEVISLLLAHPRAADTEASAELMGLEGSPADVDDSLPCVCQGQPSDFDGSWVSCDVCGRWVHACCAGFGSAAEAEAAREYRCLVCACREGERQPRACGATLLVCPTAILGQWHDEVDKHVHGGSLRIVKYSGLREALHEGWKRPGRLASLHPAHLGACDLVLTTFETLRAELDHAPDEAAQEVAGRQMRSRPSGGGAGGGSGSCGDGDVHVLHPRGRGTANDVRRTVSPLLSLTWWRLVLDEAQMVESGTAKAAAMARRLRATHRWAVSGTPMGRGRLGDLQGLMAFLRLAPWDERAWWSHAIELPLGGGNGGGSAAGADAATARAAAAAHAADGGCGGPEGRLPLGTSAEEAEGRLMALLHSVMWRNSKEAVEAQLEIPPIRERMHTLTLSSIERHFYGKQHRECLASAQKALALRDTQANLKVGTVKAGHVAAAAERALTVLSIQGVLRLRQACCHPQLGAFGIKGRRGGSGQQHLGLANPLSMRAILAKLIEDERSQCEEQQRKILFNLSALGSMQAMKGRYAHAAAAYAEGLTLACAHRTPTPLELDIEVELLGPIARGFSAGAVSGGGRQAAGPLAVAAGAGGAGAGAADAGASNAVAADDTPEAGTRRGEGPSGVSQRRLGPLRWQLPTDASSASAVTSEGEVQSADDLWMRIELSRPRRLSELRLRCVAGPHATPARCSLDAASGTEAAGVFVEVATFDVAPPPATPPLAAPSLMDLSAVHAPSSTGIQAGSDSAVPGAPEGWQSLGGSDSAVLGAPEGWQSLGFYRPFKSRQYRLRIHSWHPPRTARASAAAGVGGDVLLWLEVGEMQLMEAELEADALQLLHMTHNHAACRRHAVEQAQHAPRVEQAGHAEHAPSGEPPDDVERRAERLQPKTDLADVSTEHEPPLIADATRLHAQLVSERSAVASAQRAHWSHARDEVERRLERMGTSAWLAHASRAIASLPAQQAALLRDKWLAEASLSGAAASACAISAAAAVEWLLRERQRSHELRERLTRGLLALAPHPSTEEVHQSGDCMRCRQDWGKKGAVCAHCHLEAHYDAYFYTLFRHRRQRKVEIVPSHNLAGQFASDAGAAAGNTGEAFLEDGPQLHLIHALTSWLGSQAALASNMPAPAAAEAVGAASGALMAAGAGGAGAALWTALSEEATRENELIAHLKRELRASRALWVAHFDLLSQLDELTTAVTTMELVKTAEEMEALAPIEAERHRFVGLWEYAERKQKYEADLLLARDDLRAARSQYAFLRQQADQIDTEAAGEAPHELESCPVCHEEMGRERTVPRCAHSLCSACAEKIMRRHGGRFVCPLCREPSDAPALASELRWADGSSKGTRVIGSWGTKVTAVVEAVLGLPVGDKCLIFSQWDDLLALIARALHDNGVRHGRLQGRQTLDAELYAFRHSTEVRALLLPLRSGANGINLVEAQHVMLVEPLIERAVEAQAIGRIHRMSQTRETTVHRFVVRDTIEESILGLRKAGAATESATPAVTDGSGAEGSAAPGSHSARAAAQAGGSPSKRTRKVEESKVLSWDTVQALFSS